MKLAGVKNNPEIMQKLSLGPDAASSNGYLIPWQTVTTYEFQKLINIKAKENTPKRGENDEQSCW